VRDALVVSLKTGLSGRSFSGRMYFPITAAPFSANHQLGQSQCNSWATATGNLFNSVNASGYGTWTPQVIVANDKDFPPFVTQVKVDSNPDTQRRREDKLRAAFFKLQDVLV
jgi:hypothetical protein